MAPLAMVVSSSTVARDVGEMARKIWERPVSWRGSVVS